MRVRAITRRFRVASAVETMRRRLAWTAGITLLEIAFLIGSVDPGLAVTIEASGSFNFLDVRSPNTAGLATGSRVSFGLTNVTPNPRSHGDFGTTVTATQGALTVPLTYIDSPASPNQFFGSTSCPSPCGVSAPPPPSLQGAWQFTIANPNSSNSPVTVTSPTLGAVTAPDFVSSMSIGPGPTPNQPVLQWAYPSTGGFGSAAIQIFDLDDRITPGGSARLIFENFNIPLAQQSFTIPAAFPGAPGGLQPGVRYSVAIQLDDRRANGSLEARSRSFFDFTLPEAGAPTAFLPTVGPDGVYRFQIDGIVAGETIFIDPSVAVGYDYAVADGDPNFASVILPNVGDGIFDVLVGGAHNVVLAGQQFFFPLGGADAFGVRGIEVSAGLDPLDVTAFVTGLTFTTDGSFNGTMTPVTVFVPDGTVPEPSGIVLLVTGVLGLGIAALGRRGRHSRRPAT